MKTGSAFLHEKNPSFHASSEVETVANYLRVSGESIPNQPAEKISAYLGFLASKELVNDGVLTGDERSIDRQVEAASVHLTSENANAYIKFQAKVARELGRGGEINPDALDEKTKMDALRLVRKDQQKQLHDWVNELNSEENKYPDWFRHWMFESVKRYSAFNDEAGKNGQPRGFEKRSRSSFALFPELDRESVSLVYDALTEKLGGQPMGFEYDNMRKVLDKAHFNELYAEAQNYGFKITDKLKAITTGSWRDFEQSDHRDDAEALSGLVRSYRTGWCTAGIETASIQLSSGDFYVWCSTNPDTNKNEVPRIAVRMEQGEIAEVRGIVGGQRQELESELADIAVSKIANLPGGEGYFKKAADMKRLTEIEKKHNGKQELDREDLRFLYEIDARIDGFGYDQDPRIEELRDQRDWLADMMFISGKGSESEVAEWLLEEPEYIKCLTDGLWNGEFTQLDESIALRIAGIGEGEYSNILARSINTFPGLTYEKLAKMIINSGELGIQRLAWTLPEYHNLSRDMAELMIRDGHIESVYWGIDAFADFEGIDESELSLSQDERLTLKEMNESQRIYGERITMIELKYYDEMDADKMQVAVEDYVYGMLAISEERQNRTTA